MNHDNYSYFFHVVLEEIFSMLAPKDLISLAQTCTSLHKMINESNQLWAKVCFNKFKIRVPRANGFARRFYKNGNDSLYICVKLFIYEINLYYNLISF